jgi:hypothetical protein
MRLSELTKIIETSTPLPPLLMGQAIVVVAVVVLVLELPFKEEGSITAEVELLPFPCLTTTLPPLHHRRHRHHHHSRRRSKSTECGFWGLMG